MNSVLRIVVRPVTRLLSKVIFERKGSKGYWEARYAMGGNSGGGSYGRLAVFKADVLNNVIAKYGIGSIIELGCGDGNQTSLMEFSGGYSLPRFRYFPDCYWSKFGEV